MVREAHKDIKDIELIKLGPGQTVLITEPQNLIHTSFKVIFSGQDLLVRIRTLRSHHDSSSLGGTIYSNYFRNKRYKKRENFNRDKNIINTG